MILMMLKKKRVFLPVLMRLILSTENQYQFMLPSYVLMGYGTGIVMGVPAHDERDFDFAVKFDLHRRMVIKAEGVLSDADGNVKNLMKVHGFLINSGAFNGLDAATEGREKIVEYIIDKSIARTRIPL